MEGGTLTPDVDAQCTATVLRETPSGPSRTSGRGPRPECPLQIQLVLYIMCKFNIACFMHRRLARFACSHGDRTEPPSLPPKRETPAPCAAGARPSFKPAFARRGGRTALPPPSYPRPPPTCHTMLEERGGGAHCGADRATAAGRPRE